jgi:hypothetical protein
MTNDYHALARWPKFYQLEFYVLVKVNRSAASRVGLAGSDDALYRQSSVLRPLGRRGGANRFAEGAPQGGAQPALCSAVRCADWHGRPRTKHLSKGMAFSSLTRWRQRRWCQRRQGTGVVTHQRSHGNEVRDRTEHAMREAGRTGCRRPFLSVKGYLDVGATLRFVDALRMRCFPVATTLRPTWSSGRRAGRSRRLDETDARVLYADGLPHGMGVHFTNSPRPHPAGLFFALRALAWRDHAVLRPLLTAARTPQRRHAYRRTVTCRPRSLGRRACRACRAHDQVGRGTCTSE